MLSVLLKEEPGFRFYFVLSDGSCSYGGGLRGDGELYCDPACPQKELMLRALINKCMNEWVPLVTARDEWGVDLARFGFVREGDLFRSSWQDLCLPHDCGNG